MLFALGKSDWAAGIAGRLDESAGRNVRTLAHVSRVPGSIGSTFVILLLIALPARAADPKNPFAWLVGTWVGEGLGGVVEETWLPMRAGSMFHRFALWRRNWTARAPSLCGAGKGWVVTKR